MAKIYTLTICHTCHHVVPKDEGFTVWEGSIYCDSCYEKYLELIEPMNFPKTLSSTISPVVE